MNKREVYLSWFLLIFAGISLGVSLVNQSLNYMGVAVIFLYLEHTVEISALKRGKDE